jgi:hypothetical protein
MPTSWRRNVQHSTGPLRGRERRYGGQQLSSNADCDTDTALPDDGRECVRCDADSAYTVRLRFHGGCRRFGERLILGHHVESAVNLRMTIVTGVAAVRH